MAEAKKRLKYLKKTPIQMHFNCKILKLFISLVSTFLCHDFSYT